jgi:hypothetical protein
MYIYYACRKRWIVMMAYGYALIVVGFKVLNVGFRVYRRVFRCPRI